jgi:hypothetical protein
MIDPRQFILAAGLPNDENDVKKILGEDAVPAATLSTQITGRMASLPAQPADFDPTSKTTQLMEFAKNWPVRSQHWSRGTCTAFSFTAMCEYHAAQGKAQPQEPPYSEEYLYSKMRREHSEDGPPNAGTGSTYLAQAILAMQNHGLCPRSSLPHQGRQDHPAWSAKDTREIESRLSPHILQKRPPFYWRKKIEDLTDPMPYSVGSFASLMTAFEIPICISLPIYPDGDILPWTFGVGWDTGVIPEPTEDWRDIPLDELSGHSVCLVGSIADEDAPGKGWFIFRNSWGSEFATRTPHVERLKEVHMPGYGAISFEHVQQHCWEVAFLVPSVL